MVGTTLMHIADYIAIGILIACILVAAVKIVPDVIQNKKPGVPHAEL